MMQIIAVPIIFSMLILMPGRAHSANTTAQAFTLWPDTGQTYCSDDNGNVLNPCPAPGMAFHGQDAQNSGPARSYTKLDATGGALPESASSWAMILDNVTGLVWEAKTARDGEPDYANPRDADNTYTWCDVDPDINGGNEGSCDGNHTSGFLAALNDAALGGHTDWRLPTIHELLTLADRGRYDRAADPAFFPLTASSYYWSSTTYAGNAGYAWFVNFTNGNGDSFTKSDFHYVRAVRGSGELAAARFTGNGDGTVTDILTCLRWQQATADADGDGVPDPLSWRNALAYANNLSLAGFEDWRLPDIHELLSIVDFVRYKPAIDTDAFPDTGSNYYWSSTTFHHLATHAWRIFFGNGYDMGYRKLDMSYARSVRGSQCGVVEQSTLTDPSGRFPAHLLLLLLGDKTWK